MVTLTGFSFAVTEWAPYALIAKVVLKEPSRVEEAAPDERTPLVGGQDFTAEQDSQSRNTHDDPTHLHNQIGLILGIHNISIVAPQFVMTGISSLVFAILDPESAIGDPSQPGSDNLEPQYQGSGLRSFAVIYRVAGLSALVAAVLAWRLSRKLKNEL